MKLIMVESMEQVLEHGLVRMPKALVAKPVEPVGAVEPSEPVDEESPAAPDKMQRRFPGGEQPPAIARQIAEDGAGG
jgi:hypothetical protein